MGRQTAPVIVGFLCTHIATVLDIVGLVEPFWLRGDYNGTIPENSTVASPSKGIWKFCKDSGNCSALHDMGNVTSTAATMQGLDTSGTGFVVVALVCTYIFFFFGKCHKNRKLNGFIVFALLASSALTLSAIVYFSQKGFTDATEFSSEFNTEYGYAFWVSIAGCAITFLSFLFSIRVCTLMKRDMDGYESI